MAMPLIILRAILVSLLLANAIPRSNALICSANHQTPSLCSDDQDSLACEVERAKLEIARLESVLQDRIEVTNARNQYFRQCEKKIEELNSEFDRLKGEFLRFESDRLLGDEKLSALEEEVRLLWAASRKNNFEIHELEQKAKDSENRVKQAASRVEKVAEIVSEQWIQIQQLEQAVYMAEVRAAKFRGELWRRCPFLKFFLDLFDDCRELLKHFAPRDGSFLFRFKSLALRTFAAAKLYHHQLQGYIKDVMKSNQSTAALANEEVVFFVASTLFVVPIMTTCMLLLSQWN